MGARIKAEFVDRGRKRVVYRHIGSGGSFGANPLMEHIGIGKAAQVDRLEIFWPTTGRSQSLANVPVDRFLVITEGERKPEVVRP
ncbi:MAG: ASPIC/UnbV domain-containing protein [Verrucomicrobiota bacterium]